MEDLEYRNVHSTFGAARHAFSARSSRRQSKRVAIGSQTNQDVLTSLYLSLPILFVQSHTTITSVVVTKPSPSLAILQKRDLTLAAVRHLEGKICIFHTRGRRRPHDPRLAARPEEHERGVRESASSSERNQGTYAGLKEDGEKGGAREREREERERERGGGGGRGGGNRRVGR